MKAIQTMTIVWLVMVIFNPTSTANFTQTTIPDLVQFVSTIFAELSGKSGHLQRIENYFCRDHCSYTAPSFLNPLTGTFKQAHDTLVDPFFGQLGRCLHCSCGSDCRNIGNCCYPQVNQPSTPQNITFECVSTDMATRFGVFKSVIRGRWYHMIKRCPESIPSDQEMVGKCENPDLTFVDQAVPVTSLITGRNYLNIFCAVCNNEDKVESWNARFEMGLQWWPFVRTVHSPKDFLSLFLRDINPSTETNIYFTPPEHLYRGTHNECYPQDKLQNACFKDVTDIAHSDRLFVQACESVPTHGDMQAALQVFQYDQFYYKNVFCWLCLGTLLHETIKPINYTADLLNSGTQSDGGVPLLYLLSGSVALDTGDTMDADNGNADGCTCREVFSPTEGFCRAVLCPVGEYYVACDCIPFMHIAPFFAKIPLTVKLLHQNTSYIGVNDGNLYTFTRNLASTVTGILQDLASVEIEELFFYNLYDVVSEKDHYNVFPFFFEILDTIQIRKSLRKIYDVVDAGIEIETGDNKFNVVFEDKFETRMETEDGIYYVMTVTMTETFANSHSVTPLNQQTLMEDPEEDVLKKVELAEPFRKASFCKLVCIYSNESVYTLYQNGGNQESTGLVVECSSYEGLDYIRVCSEDFQASSKENQGQMVRVSQFIVSVSVITGFLSSKLLLS